MQAITRHSRSSCVAGSGSAVSLLASRGCHLHTPRSAVVCPADAVLQDSWKQAAAQAVFARLLRPMADWNDVGFHQGSGCRPRSIPESAPPRRRSIHRAPRAPSAVDAGDGGASAQEWWARRARSPITSNLARSFSPEGSQWSDRQGSPFKRQPDLGWRSRGGISPEKWTLMIRPGLESEDHGEDQDHRQSNDGDHHPVGKWFIHVCSWIGLLSPRRTQ